MNATNEKAASLEQQRKTWESKASQLEKQLKLQQSANDAEIQKEKTLAEQFAKEKESLRKDL